MHKTTAKVLSELKVQGFSCVDGVFNGEFLEKLQRKNRERWKAFKNSKVFLKHDGAVRERAKFKGNTAIFLTKGRYDLELDYGIFASKDFVENDKIMGVVKFLFKTGYTYYAGSVPSSSGSSYGEWHQDTWPLFDDALLEGSLPPYYLTVLIPLVDLDASNGTEVIIGSHRGKKLGTHIVVSAKAGSAIILDGRIHHRGLSNTTDKTRHMLYIVYCKRWYHEYWEGDEAHECDGFA